MSDNSFEKKFGEWLKAAGLWYYHPPDSPQGRQWRPADYIVGWKTGFALVECKEVQTRKFSLANWTPQQRNFASQVQGHGLYFLVVHFAVHSKVVAYFYAPDSLWPSLFPLTPEMGFEVTKQSVRSMFVRISEPLL